MRRYKIESNKDFMQKLLMTDTFEPFLLLEADVVMAQKYHIDGRLEKAFFDAEEWDDTENRPYDYSSWEEIKPIVMQMIKGKKTPVSMKIILLLKPEHTDRVLRELLTETERNLISGLTLAIHFDTKGLYLISGVSYDGFLMNKEPEKKWDLQMGIFLEKHGIGWSEE